jgi:hypothetical protein
VKRPPRLRDAWVFVRPAGFSGGLGDPYRPAEGWSVWVQEVWDASARPHYIVGARMWGQRVAVADCVIEWTGPHFTVSGPKRFESLHPARVNACGLVLLLSGSMSAEGLGRRCPRGRYLRDGRVADATQCPWQWMHEPFGTAFADESLSR